MRLFTLLASAVVVMSAGPIVAAFTMASAQSLITPAPAAQAREVQRRTPPPSVSPCIGAPSASCEYEETIRQLAMRPVPAGVLRAMPLRELSVNTGVHLVPVK